MITFDRCPKCSGRGYYLFVNIEVECYHCDGDGVVST